MAATIRLARRGRKAYKLFDIVVADKRAPRDGRYIEKLGTYNPNVHPYEVVLNEEKAFEWIMKGASPTETAKKLLSEKGVMLRKHLQVGVNKGAIKQEEADKKYAAWLEDKAKRNAEALEKLSKDEQQKLKDRLAAEKKIAEARKEAIKQKEVAEELGETTEAPAAEEAGDATAEAAPADTAEAPATEEAKTEEAPEAKTEEAPKEEPKAEEKEEPAKEEAPKAEEKKESAPAEAAADKEEPKAEAKEEAPAEAEKKEE